MSGLSYRAPRRPVYRSLSFRMGLLCSGSGPEDSDQNKRCCFTIFRYWALPQATYHRRTKSHKTYLQEKWRSNTQTIVNSLTISHRGRPHGRAWMIPANWLVKYQQSTLLDLGNIPIAKEGGANLAKLRSRMGTTSPNMVRKGFRAGIPNQVFSSMGQDGVGWWVRPADCG